MKPIFSRCVAVALLVLAVLGALHVGVRAADPARAPIVILVSVDGLAAYNFDDPAVDIPTIRWMAANGARAKSMETVFPSVTWPTHTTLVTGVRPGRHGVLGNSYYDRAQNKKIPLLPDPGEQADCYSAAYEVWTRETSWMRGVFWWSWSVPPPAVGDTGFDPRRKPAEDVLRQRLAAP